MDSGFLNEILAFAHAWGPMALDIASGVCFAVGAVFLIIGAVGMVRLPDFWSRLHGAGIIDTLGVELVLIGLMLQSGLTIVTVKLILIGLFVFFTSPTATHATANAAYVAGLRPKGMREPAPDVLETTEEPQHIHEAETVAETQERMEEALTPPVAEGQIWPVEQTTDTPVAPSEPEAAPSTATQTAPKKSGAKKKRAIIEIVDDEDDEGGKTS